MTASSRVTLVTGGDAGYFPLLEELTRSLRRLPGGESQPLVILDGGLEPTQRTALEALGARTLDPGWCDPHAERRARGRAHLKINVAKLHLDRLLPEADIIAWIDGDAWLQTLDCLDLFRMVADKGKFAVVSQASRRQTRQVSFRRLVGGYVELRNILYKNARRAGLPAHLSTALMARPTLNAGAFALSARAPHWSRWRHWQEQVLQRGRLFTSDQLAMGLAAYVDGLPFEALPASCNYMGPWRWDAARGQFVDFCPPYAPVSVIHLVGQDAMRADASVTVEMVDMADRPMRASLRFGHTPADVPATE